MTDLEVVRLISEGYRQKEIAAVMDIPTSAKRIARIQKKHGAKTMSHLVTIFFRKGLLK